MTDIAAPEQVTYVAKSVLWSSTLWFNLANFVVAVLSMTEIVTLIPQKYLPVQAAVVAVINMYLRTTTTRPVAFIAPGDTKAVKVDKLGPPPPSTMTA